MKEVWVSRSRTVVAFFSKMKKIGERGVKGGLASTPTENLYVRGRKCEED